jgi:hypothetical protein
MDMGRREGMTSMKPYDMSPADVE